MTSKNNSLCFGGLDGMTATQPLENTLSPVQPRESDTPIQS